MADPPPVADVDPFLAFMQQLGIHPAEQLTFGWIAEYGLKEDALPPHWTMHTDHGTGHLYYVDCVMRASTWDNPLTPALRRILETGRLYLQKPQEEFFEERKSFLWQEHKWELECWCGPFKDPSGRPYFANSVTGLSSWRDPREETQYIYELESGLLDNLQEVLVPPLEVARHTIHRHSEAGSTFHPSRTTASVEPSPSCHMSCTSAAVDLVEDFEPPESLFCGSDGGDFLQVPCLRLASPTEVLTAVESLSGAGEPQERRLQAEAQNVSIYEHKRALDKLSGAARWLHKESRNEAESQRLLLAEKRHARRLRAEPGRPPELRRYTSSELDGSLGEAASSIDSTVASRTERMGLPLGNDGCPARRKEEA